MLHRDNVHRGRAGTKHPEAGPRHWCTQMCTPDFIHHNWNSTKDPKVYNSKLLYYYIFEYFVNIFSIVPYYLPLEMSRILQIIWTSLNSFIQWWCVSILVHWFWKRVFQFRQYIFDLSLSSPLGKGQDSLNLEYLSFKDAECQFWLILSQRFWKRRFVFLISSLHFCYSLIISTWTNLYLHCSWMLFLPYLFEIGSMVIEEKTKIWKAHNNDEKNNNDYRQRANFDRKSSPE